MWNRVLVLASKVRWPELSQLSLCSEFDKENSIEFLLNSLLLIYFTTVAMHLLSHGPHVTHYDYDPWCDHLWPSVTPLWHCDKVTWYFSTLHFVVISPIRKEKKRNINNDLAVLLSYDTWHPNIEQDIGKTTEDFPRTEEFLKTIRKIRNKVKEVLEKMNVMMKKKWDTKKKLEIERKNRDLV